MSWHGSKSHPIPFGVKAEGRLVPVHDVQRGAKCGCVCPRCGKPLVARKGKIRAHHFAHAPGVPHCEGAAETALHLMAKQIVGEARSIELPKMTVLEPETTEPRQSKPGEVQVCPEETMVINGSRLESAQERFRPDVVVWDDRKAVWIEIRVTHQVSEYKEDELRKDGLGCVEIDLRHLNPQSVDLNELRRVLLEDTRHKRWIAHPGEASARVEARAFCNIWGQSKNSGNN